MSQFKKGDRVVRIGPSTNYNGIFNLQNVTKGETYVVVEIRKDNVILEGAAVDHDYFESRYFILEEIYNSPLYQALL